MNTNNENEGLANTGTLDEQQEVTMQEGLNSAVLEQGAPLRVEDTTDAVINESADGAEDAYTYLPPNDEAPLAITEPKLSRAQWLQIYLIAAIFCNIYILFFEGHFDIGFWKNWVTQLATSGFTNYQGDYPPLWSNWLYLVSRFYVWTNMPIENNILFKYLTQLPVSIYHLILVYLVYKIADKTSDKETHFHVALGLTAFNPAILFNGPIWGQIDVTPLVPLIAALMAGTSKRHQLWMVPLYIVAMLTKFQMIAFAPVMGILFFRNIKTHLLGIAMSIPIFVLAFLPNILAHNFVQAFSLPYIGSMHMFSSATMGAANMWLLWVGNLSADNIVLFGIDPHSHLAQVFNVRRFGMLVFSLICLLVFIAGMKKLAANRFAQNQEVVASDFYFYAVVCSTTFFTVLPGMHERYLMPAAIIALAYYAATPGRAFFAVSLSLISFLNHTMSHGIRAVSIWPSLAWIMMAVFAYSLLQLFWGERWNKWVKKAICKISAINGIAVLVLLVSILCITSSLYQKNKVNQITAQPNQLLLTQLKPTYATQDYGVLQINLSVAENPLNIGGIRYANGFGTHANSLVKFALPEHAKSFSFIAGLDNAVEAADVTFSVWGDGRRLWQSPIIYHSEKNAGTVTLDITGVHELSLKVDGMGNIGSDHADWVNPVITLSPAN